MPEKTAKEKSEQFALRIINLYKYLTNTKQEFVISKQILRSGTSIGANLAESAYAITKNDFLSKIYIALKECAETTYWLKLLKNSKYITEKDFTSINSDCCELLKILFKIIINNIKIIKNIKKKKNF